MKPNFNNSNAYGHQSNYQAAPQQQNLSPGRQFHQSIAQNASVYSASNSLNNLKILRQQQQQAQQANQSSQQLAQLQRAQEAKKCGPEYCARCAEPNVGFIPATREIVCNTCIFQKKLTAVKFTALVSKELRTEFNTAFNQYKNGINSVSGVDTNIVKQRATILVQKFFAQIREKVKLLQRQSMGKIQQSDSLRELERIIEQSKEFFPDHAKNGDHFEREKRLFDEKIGKGRFAYLVKRQEFYQDLIQSLDKSSEKMKQTLERSSEQMGRVLRMRADGNEVRQKINEIVSECIDVDMQSVQTNHSSPGKAGMAQSPRVNGSECASNVARGSSGLNSSMQRNSVPSLNNNNNSAMQPQFSPQRQIHENKPQQVARFSGQHPPQQRQSSSPNHQQASFSPVTQQPSMATAQTPPQQVSPVVEKPTSPPEQQAAAASPSRASPVSVEAKESSDDCVIVTNVVQAPIQQGPNRLEHSFKSTYKLKGQILLKLIPGRGWVKIREMNNLMLAKTVQTLDETAFVIGGARDRNSIQTLAEVNSFIIRNAQVVTERKADLLTSRSSHGATINVHKNEIYVAGGYHSGDLTRTCEAYSVTTNQWRQLPQLNEPKCSVTLCTLNGRYLYCLGGLTKQESGAFLLGSIEVLDLEAPQPKWLMLSVKMPHQVCDVGAIPLSETDILVYGGWNKSPVNTAFIVRQTIRGPQQMHSFTPVGAQMDKNDFSMISGVAMKTADPDVIKVCCHAFLFAFNLKANAFVGSSAM